MIGRARIQHQRAAWSRRPGSSPRYQRGRNSQDQEEKLTTIVKLVDENTDQPKVRAIFADIKATKKIDRVPNIWRALASHPDHLELCWSAL